MGARGAIQRDRGAMERAALCGTMLLSLCIVPHHAQAIIDMKTQMDIFLTEAGLTEKQFKEIHFARNNNQKSDVNYSDISASDSGFRKLPPEKSIFHQIGRGNENNEKWTNDKGEEYVFNPSTNPPKLVTNSVNIGTYNFRPESDLAGHYLLDVLPYLLWGNSESDSTTFEERSRLFDKALLDTINIIKKLQNDDVPPQVVAIVKKIQADMDIENLYSQGSTLSVRNTSLDYKTLGDSKLSKLMLDLNLDNTQEIIDVEKFRFSTDPVNQQQKEEQNTQSFNDDQRIKTVDLAVKQRQEEQQKIMQAIINKYRNRSRSRLISGRPGETTVGGKPDDFPGTLPTDVFIPEPDASLGEVFGNYAYGTVAFGKSSISIMPPYRRDIAPYIISKKNLGQLISFYGLKESVPSKDSTKIASLRYSDRVRVRNRDYGDYSYVAWGSWSGDKNTRISFDSGRNYIGNVKGGHWVYGQRLGVDDIPKSGSARYAGQVMGGYSTFGMDGMPDGTQEINSITGNINMAVTFRDGNNSLSGTMNLDRNGASWATARFNTQNARANPNDSGFKASLNSEDGGRGGLRGSFFGFGTNAAEVGGNFFFLKGNKTGLANGVFRAKKQ